MKKVLIAILLLVPLLVVLTINVSSTIISAEIKIELASLKLTDMEGNVVTYVPVNLDEDNVYLLYATYFPDNASSKDLDWTTSDAKVATVKRRGNYAEVTFDWNGYDKAVEIRATSRSNQAVFASCTFFVTGNRPNRIEFSDYAGGTLSSVGLKAGEYFPVKGNVVPAASKRDAKLSWWVTDDNVATVDPNGVVHAVKVGATYLNCRIETSDRGSVTGQIPLIVSETSLSNDSVYYTTAASFDLLTAGDLDPETKVYLGDKEVDPSAVPSGSVLTLSGRGSVKTVEVKRLNDSDLVLQNARYLQEYIMPKGSGDLQLVALDQAGNAVEGDWVSLNTEVATIDDKGVVHALELGNVTFAFRAEGYSELQVPLEVGGETIGHFNLFLDNADDKRGLARERVFGIYTCLDKKVTDTLQLTIAGAYPEEVLAHPLKGNFTFATSDPAYAQVDVNGLITFHREGIGHEVTITARAKNAVGVVEDSYTFRLVNGINVGLGRNVEYDPDVDPEPSKELLALYEDARYVQNEYREDVEQYESTAALVMHSNLYMPKNVDYLEFYRSIYGNGYTYDGQIHTEYYDDRMFDTWRFRDYLLTLPEYKRDGRVDVVIQNWVIQAYHPISSDSTEAFQDLKNRGGIPIRLAPDYNNPNILIVFRYCLFQYAYAHINVESCNLRLEGCILRNCAAPSVLLQSKERVRDENGELFPNGRYSEVTIKNCIFSNTIAPALLSTAGMIDWPQEELDDIYFGRLFLEGENYIYNWKRIEELEINIFPPADPSITAILNIVGDYVSEAVREVARDEANSVLWYTDVSGEKYINFSFLMFGLWEDYNMKVNPELPYDPHDGFGVFGDPKAMRVYQFEMERGETYFRKALGSFMYDVVTENYPLDFYKNPTYIIDTFSPATGKPNTKPFETYDIDDKTIARLHGQA